MKSEILRRPTYIITVFLISTISTRIMTKIQMAGLLKFLPWAVAILEYLPRNLKKYLVPQSKMLKRKFSVSIGM